MIRPSLLFALLVVVSGCNTLRIGGPAPAPESAAVTPPLVERWTRNVEAGFGPAAPLVLGDQLMVGTREGDVVLLDTETGQVDGRQSYGDSVEGALAFSDDRRLLYVPVAAPGRVVAQDLVRGERVWRWKARDVGSPDAGVVQVGGVVVAPLTDGTIIGLDAADGSVRWQTRIDSTASYRAAPLVVDVGPQNRRAVVVDDRGVVRWIDAQTGREQLPVEIGAPVEHTPASGANGDLFVATTRGSLIRVVERGAVWRVSLGIDGERVPPRVGPPTFHADGDGGAVFAGATNGRFVAVDATTGDVRWTRDFDAHVNSAPLVSGAFVFVGMTDQRVLALDLATGETRWEAPVRGRVKSGLAAAGGLLFVLTEPRHVVAFGPPSP